MKGKTLKSKINGEIFFVEDLKQEKGKEYYIILHPKSGKRYNHEKGLFEHGLMQNLEIVENGEDQ